jgi:hypothetical protein
MKKTAQNDVTGDWLQSKPNNEMFEKNFDLIFRKKKRSDDVSPHLHEYELNKSTGAVQKVDHGDTTDTSK